MLGVLLDRFDLLIALSLRAHMMPSACPLRLVGARNPVPSAPVPRRYFRFVFCTHAQLRFLRNSIFDSCVTFLAACAWLRGGHGRWRHARPQKTSRDRGKQQPANNRAAQRRVLLAASPKPSAIGTMPIIMASAVISTGRMRVYPAATAACSAGMPSSICSRAKLTIRIELAVATPMHITAPVSDGTLNVVRVKRRNQQIPASAPATLRIYERSSHDWS